LQLGSTEIMAAQLGHLLSILAVPSVSLGVIPFSAASRPLWTLEAFTVFDDGAWVVVKQVIDGFARGIPLPNAEHALVSTTGLPAVGSLERPVR
jgi:Domain of unknown function (DUF5753)